jgi:DNA-binding protein YbaB
LEELLAAAVNKVLAQADNVSQTEMQAATRDMMGGLGNLFGK